MEKTSIRQSNKGFTLVEICVTLVLFSILATITTMSLIAWQENATYRTQEDNAELIYMAAKNKIALLNANNILDEQPEWGVNEISTVTNVGNVKKCYAYCVADDYEKFKKGNTLSNASAVLVFDLVSDHLYKKDLLEKYIMIVYSTDGLIEGVFYSDRSNIKNVFTTQNVDLSNLNGINYNMLMDSVIGAYIAK